jgi:EpsI family protein
VNLYVAYLDYQRDNRSWHSPQQCIPGGGWTITALSRVPVANADGPPTVVNRVVITKGGGKQLVYYWYRQRGMEIADELWLRLLLFRDGLIANRTDGALVRLTTPVLPDEELSAADARLAAVLAEINPVLPEYVPD